MWKTVAMFAVMSLALASTGGAEEKKTGTQRDVRAARMPAEQAVKLDRALSHLRELAALESPYLEEAISICERNGIDFMRELRTGRVVVVYEGADTGKIAWREAPPPAAPLTAPSVTTAQRSTSDVKAGSKAPQTSAK